MLKRLLGDSFIYGFTGYLSVLAGIILTPIYSRILTKTEYGILDIFNTWNTFAMAIIPLGLISSIITFYPDVKDDPTQRKKLLGTILTTIFFFSFIYAIIMLLFKNIIISYIAEPNVTEIFHHSIFIVIMSLFFAYTKVIQQAKFKKYNFAIIALFNFILLSTLGFLFVYYYRMGVLGFYRASSVSISLTVILSFFMTKKDIFFDFDRIILKKVLTYSIHFLSVFFLFQVINIIDRYILLHYSTIEDVGIYNIGSKISGIIKIVFSAFAVAWFPIAMNIKNNENAKETYQLVHNVYFTVSLVLISALLFFRKELILFFAPSYMEAYNIIGILALAYAINGSIFVYSLGLHIKKETKYLTSSAIISVFTNVISSVVLMKIIGIDGVAWGTLIGAFMWIFSQHYYSQKVYPIKFNYRYAIGVILTIAGLIFLVPYAEDLLNLQLYAGVLIKASIFIMLSIPLYFYLKKGLKKI